MLVIISPAISIILVVGFFGGIFWFAVSLQRKQRIKTWQNYLAIADVLNISVVGPDLKQMGSNIPTISGRSKGRNFSLYQVIKGSGKSRTTYTNFKWDLNLTAANTIMVYKENFFTRLGSIIGLKDVQTGFEGFDKKFILIASDPNFAQKIFTNEICNVFEDAHDSFRATINLNANKIEYSEQGIITNEKNRERLLKIILASQALADKAEKNSGNNK